MCSDDLTMYLLLFVLLPKHRGMFIIAMVGVCVFIIQVSRGNVPVVNTLLQQFITQDLTTGRMDLNEEFLSYILGNTKVLFFGAGIAADRIAGVWNNVHNFILIIFTNLESLVDLFFCLRWVRVLHQFQIRFLRGMIWLNSCHWHLC